MQIGVMDHIVAALSDGSELGSFEQAHALGFAGIECSAAREDLFDTSGARLQRLLAARQATGLAIPSLCLHHHNNGGIGSEDPAVASAAEADIAQAIGWAAQLGSGVILVPFFFGGAIETPEAISRAAAAFRRLCPQAAAQGVTICYEGTLPYAGINDLAAQIDSPAFGCYFDLANVVWLGMDTPTEIRGLGRLIRQVHMKETKVGPGDCHPGEGRVNYPGSVEALRDVGYAGWMVLETPTGSAAEVAADLAFTKRYFG
ncbi:MAG: L-ribulose-5-phosphate 3-epimerase [Roseiflexaceae bacterium]